MKNKFLKGFLAAVVIALSGYGINKGVNNSNTKLNDLTLANIEALAQDESGSGCGTPKLSDPIWHVSVEIGGSVGSVFFPKITCNTGGCYVCGSSTK